MTNERGSPTPDVLASITGEQTTHVIRRHSSTLVFTDSWVVKHFADEPAERTIQRYRWLTEHGDLDCRVKHLGSGLPGNPLALVMERLPNERCLLTMLANATATLDHIDSLITKMRFLHAAEQRHTMPIGSMAQALRENIAKQVRLLSDDGLAPVARLVMVRYARMVPTLPTPVGYWQPVSHGDLHAANVFVLRERVPLIDPAFSEPRARMLPFFTELASLYADTLGHHRPDIARRIRDHFLTVSDPPHWKLFLLCVCLKILVRHRIAIQTPRPDRVATHRSGDEWCSDAITTAKMVTMVLAELSGGDVEMPWLI